jgi:hypothetical protein
MKRCIGYQKNNKKCRNRVHGDELFCCESHRPFNYDFIEDGCYICMEKNIDTKDMYLFKCRHIFHKQCYDDWLKVSTYNEPICIICKNAIFKKNIIYRKYDNDINYIMKTINILNNYI